jgi:hypothetical protein
MKPGKYVKNPFYVEAVQVTADNLDEVARWCSGEIIKSLLPKVDRAPDDTEAVECVKVPVLRPANDRWTKAFVGDWVVKAGAGFKVYAAKAFKRDFKPRPTEG